MSDYKETTLAGTSWMRCHQITVTNPRGAPPAVEFAEERVLALDDGQEIRQNLPVLPVSFDAARMIPLLDPQTGEATGAEVSYAYAYQLLYSAYMAAALVRDANLAAQSLHPEQPV